jgi:hypothetical protein
MSPPLQGSTLPHLPIRVRLAALTVDSQPAPPILLGAQWSDGSSPEGLREGAQEINETTSS